MKTFNNYVKLRGVCMCVCGREGGLSGGGGDESFNTWIDIKLFLSQQYVVQTRIQ